MKIHGKYTSANIYAETIEDGVISQVYDIINSKAFKGKKVCLMEDCHVGKSGPCGLVAEIGDYVCPEHVGLDIGCSVSIMKLDKKIKKEDYVLLEARIRRNVPFGFNIHKETVVDEKAFRKFLSQQFSKYKAMQPELLYSLPDNVTENWISDVLKRIGMTEAMFWKSLGTVGGGNHFCEIDSDGTEDIVTLHFGSRNFGLKICEYWTNIAKGNKKLTKKEQTAIIMQCKKEYGKMDEGFEKYMRDALEKAVSKTGKVNGYLDGDDMKGYLCDAVFSQCYARYNHMTVQNIIIKILEKFGIHPVSSIYTTHNYIDFRNFTLRKSAISANLGEAVVIPFNMRDGIAICEGLGNDDRLCSAPHGAGRKMSRSKAKDNISLDEFKKTMDGIYSTTVCEGTIDEAPQAYKDTNEIIRQIEGQTVNIVKLYKPVINIKAVETKKWR